MIERYQGNEGKLRLTEALRNQRIIQGNASLATVLADLVTLREFKSNDVLIEQGASDNDLYFVVSGSLAVHVNGCRIGERVPGDHVGEISLIDTSMRRSATITATSEAVVAAISESTFTRLADSYPQLWRSLAIELIQRLHQNDLTFDSSD